MDPEIIKAAAQSPLGILALMVMVLSTIALAFFKDAPVWAKLLVFTLLLAGAAAFAFSIRTVARIVDPPPQVGFIYYGRNADGTPSDGGKLQLADGGPLPLVQNIKSGTVFKGVDVKQLRERPTNSSASLAQVPVGVCYRTLHVETGKPFINGEGAWLDVKTVRCPD